MVSDAIKTQLLKQLTTTDHYEGAQMITNYQQTTTNYR